MSLAAVTFPAGQTAKNDFGKNIEAVHEGT